MCCIRFVLRNRVYIFLGKASNVGYPTILHLFDIQSRTANQIIEHDGKISVSYNPTSVVGGFQPLEFDAGWILAPEHDRGFWTLY